MAVRGAPTPRLACRRLRGRSQVYVPWAVERGFGVPVPWSDRRVRSRNHAARRPSNSAVVPPHDAMAVSSRCRLRSVGRRKPDSQKEMVASEQPTAAERHACFFSVRRRTSRRQYANDRSPSSSSAPDATGGAFPMSHFHFGEGVARGRSLHRYRRVVPAAARAGLPFCRTGADRDRSIGSFFKQSRCRRRNIRPCMQGR
jgi:hypothetical protein